MPNKVVFKQVYILGEGYPWAIGLSPYTSIALAKGRIGLTPVDLRVPNELWSKEVPKYRLVLEKVEDAE